MLSGLSDKELHEFLRLEQVIKLDTRLKVLHEFFKENDKKPSQCGMTLGRQVHALYARIRERLLYNGLIYALPFVQAPSIEKLFSRLKFAKADGSYLKELVKMEKQNLPLIEDQHGKRSTLITSQVLVAQW